MVGIGNAIATVLVIGATGNTGKHVVRQLLDQGQHVHVIVRSKQRMLDVLPVSSIHEQNRDNDLLSIREASLFNMSTEDIENSVRDAKAVVCCLGHNLDFQGMFGEPKRLVTDSVKTLTNALMNVSSNNNNNNINPPKKFILMSSDGVIHPDGTDDKHSLTVRLLLHLIRNLLPPHADNEEAALVMHSIGSKSNIDWTVVRPTNLINNDNTTEYEIFNKPHGSLFGNTQVTRSNVAKFMVDLINQDDLWQKWRFQYPVIYDALIIPNKEDPAKDL